MQSLHASIPVLFDLLREFQLLTYVEQFYTEFDLLVAPVLSINEVPPAIYNKLRGRVFWGCRYSGITGEYLRCPTTRIAIVRIAGSQRSLRQRSLYKNLRHLLSLFACRLIATYMSLNCGSLN